MGEIQQGVNQDSASPSASGNNASDPNRQGIPSSQRPGTQMPESPISSGSQSASHKPAQSSHSHHGSPHLAPKVSVQHSKHSEEPAGISAIGNPLGKAKEKIAYVYEHHYKALLIIPFLVLFLAIAQIGYQVATTGDFIHKGVSLSGGVSITIPVETDVDSDALENQLLSRFPSLDVNVRSLESLGSKTAVVIEADIDPNDNAEFAAFIQAVGQSLGRELGASDYSVEFFGSSLGANFFNQAFQAMLVAFLFMSIVVFILFRSFVPSSAVILAAFSDIVVTIAVVNILGVKVSTAGIAGFLMLIGYSVDTDILLSSRVLKRTDGTVQDRIYSSLRTGIMLTLTALAVTIIGFIFSNSDVLSQIMLIVTIGLLADLVFTWIQNAGILKWYMEAKHKF